jgi:hypothetical protein
MKSARRRRLALWPSVVAVLSSLLGSVRAAGPGPWRIEIHHPGDAGIVVAALNGAFRKLQQPACQQLFEDFRDSDGRIFREKLAPLTTEPAEYLSLLTYRDGRDLASKRCRKGGAAAVTHPGDHAVYVCLASFIEQRAGIRENTLIHEMLHSLGLGENPPSSAKINGQVRRRCGS